MSSLCILYWITSGLVLACILAKGHQEKAQKKRSVLGKGGRKAYRVGSVLLGWVRLPEPNNFLMPYFSKSQTSILLKVLYYLYDVYRTINVLERVFGWHPTASVVLGLSIDKKVSITRC